MSDPSDAEKIAREIALKVCENWEVTRGGLERSLCIDAATLAYAAGFQAAREKAAGVVVENYQGLSQEHRLLLLNRSVAIRSMEMEK